MSVGFPKGWDIAPLGSQLEALLDYRGVPPPKAAAGVPLLTAKIVKG
jgi:type I restriction enzyme, S subunit